MSFESVLLRDVEVDGVIIDVRVKDGRVEAIGPQLSVPAHVRVIDGRRGALLPGLHDHHIHLLGVAAAAGSIDVSALDRSAFNAALRRADASAVIGADLRVIGYHESTVGPLDRAALDAVVPHRPVRVQHASGAMWVLNSAGLTAAPLHLAPEERVELDADGERTGRLFGLDGWLGRHRPRAALDLAAVGRQLAHYGICGVTDMTPYRERQDLEVLRDAVSSGAIPQATVVTGAPTLDRHGLEPLTIGPAKIIVDDFAPPAINELAHDIRAAHEQQIVVALHCASRLGIVLAIAALEQAGSRPGDRVEHGAVIPSDLFARLRNLGVVVVTQPAFVYTRGDRYLSDVEPEDVAHLWRCGSLIDAGIPVGFGSDAPHGPLDPWQAIRAATERCTRQGRSLGATERVGRRYALARFLSSWRDPGGPPRRIHVGARADLCLLHLPLMEALRDPSASGVRLTIVKGTTYST